MNKVNEVKLPSGNTVLNLLDDDAQDNKSEASDDNIESTSGTLSLDVEGQCPKCCMIMSEASANDESVYWCNNCRVTVPLTIK